MKRSGLKGVFAALALASAGAGLGAFARVDDRLEADRIGAASGSKATTTKDGAGPTDAPHNHRIQLARNTGPRRRFGDESPPAGLFRGQNEVGLTDDEHR
jgi:hypothetical protein